MTKELCRIYAAESLLASLEASGVDNCRIEVEMRNGPNINATEGEEPETPEEPQVQLEGQELPFSDGSALFWANTIKEVTVRPAPGVETTEPRQKSLYAPKKVSLHLTDQDAAFRYI